MKQNGDSSKPLTANEFTIGSVVFEKFEILSFVAAGGFGRVFKARDVLRNSEVALKVLAETRDDKALVRFQREARTASRLKHSSIATIYDFGLADGTPYLSMEFVEGDSLEAILCEHATLTLSEFTQVFMQITEGLNHAHNNGVIHRDLKPANIVVRQTPDGELKAKILDFGVATLSDRSQDEQGRLTPTGNIVGSPLYMSPEQGQGKTVDLKSDVYSLGCMMYRCLTGQSPFRGDTAIETILAHQNLTAPRLADFFDESPPEELCELIERMLSKQPEERPPLATEVLPILSSLHKELLNLEQASENDILEQRTIGDTSVSDRHPESRRTRTVVISTAIIVTVALLAVSVLLRGKQNEPHRTRLKLNDIVSVPFASEDEVESSFPDSYKKPDLQAYNGQAVYSFHNTSCTDADLLKLEKPEQLKNLDLSRTQVKTLTNIGTFKNLEVLNLDRAPLRDGAIENLKSLRHLHTLRVSHTGISDLSLPSIARLTQLTELNISNTRISLNGIVKSLKPLVNLRILQIAVDQDLNIDLIRQIVHAFPRLGQLDIRHCKGVNPAFLSSLKNQFPDIAFTPDRAMIFDLVSKADHDRKAKDFRSAVMSLEKVKSILRNTYGDKSERLTPYYLKSAWNSFESGDWQKSERDAGEASALAELNRDFNLKVASLDLLASIAQSKKDFEQFEKYKSQAYKLATAERFEDVDKRATELGNYLYVKKGGLSTAFKYYQEALSIRKKNSTRDDPQTALLLILRAECERRSGQLAQARKDYNAAIIMFSKSPPQTDFQKNTLSVSYTGLADLDLREGNMESALRNNEKAISLCKERNLAPSYLATARVQRKALSGYRTRLTRP